MYQKRNVPPLRIAKSSSKLSQDDTSEESFQNVVFFPCLHDINAHVFWSNLTSFL